MSPGGGSRVDLLEGDPLPEWIFIIEFPTADAARRWYPDRTGRRACSVSSEIRAGETVSYASQLPSSQWTRLCEPPVPLKSNTSVYTGFGGGAQHVWLERQHDAIGLVAQA
jgi:Domain of unknown function (DUF1330)